MAGVWQTTRLDDLFFFAHGRRGQAHPLFRSPQRFPPGMSCIAFGLFRCHIWDVRAATSLPLPLWASQTEASIVLAYLMSCPLKVKNV